MGSSGRYTRYVSGYSYTTTHSFEHVRPYRNESGGIGLPNNGVLMFRAKRGMCVFDVHVEKDKVYLYPADGGKGQSAWVKAILEREQTLSHLFLSASTNGDAEEGLVSYYKQRNWRVVRVVPMLKINDQGKVHTVYLEDRDP